jgi:hypothetical protein
MENRKCKFDGQTEHIVCSLSAAKTSTGGVHWLPPFEISDLGKIVYTVNQPQQY